MGFLMKILGLASGNTAEVSANNELLVRPATTVANVGYVALASRSDPGSTGNSPRTRAVWATSANQLRCAETEYWWDDTFNATAQNTSKYRFAATTMTAAMASGFLTLNNSGITTANTNVAVQTFKTFPIFGNSEVTCGISAQFPTANAPVANSITEFGLFSATIPGGAAPTDGVFFRYNAAGELRGVVSFNGTETQTAAITQPSTNVTHDYLIVFNTDEVEFWIDRVFYAALQLVTDAPSQGQPFMQAEQPFTVRQYILTSTPATVTKFQITDIWVKSIGPALGRPFSHVKAGMGHMAYQGQDGGTMGTTAQWANNSNPAAAVPTNTTAALGTGLGGKFQETLTLASGTDGIISSFQNPTGGVNQTPRNLVITGVSISGVVSVVLSTNPLAGVMALCYGHTNVSLATAEGTSFTTSPTTKAPRRIALCTTSLANSSAPVGTPVVTGPVSWVFQSPIIVAPGEFIAICHNKVATAPASGAVFWTITFDGYFE